MWRGVIEDQAETQVDRSEPRINSVRKSGLVFESCFQSTKMNRAFAKMARSELCELSAPNAASE
jgi:hypothetical protein